MKKVIYARVANALRDEASVSLSLQVFDAFRHTPFEHFPLSAQENDKLSERPLFVFKGDDFLNNQDTLSLTRSGDWIYVTLEKRPKEETISVHVENTTLQFYSQESYLVTSFL